MILQEYETEDIAEFTGDFIPLIKMASTIDGMIRVDEPTWFSQNMQAFHKCFDLFHKKYRDIKLQIIEGDMFRIRVFFIGTTIKHIPDFELCCYFGCLHGFDHSIDIVREAALFMNTNALKAIFPDRRL